LHHPQIAPDTVTGRLPIAAQQIVEIARAVAIGCRVLVLDEPTSSLARADAEALFALVGRLRAQGNAIIYITHFIEEAQRLADRYTVLRDGQTVGGGAHGKGEMAGATVPEIVDLMVGRRVEQLYPRGARTRGEPLLEVTGLSGAPKPVRASFTLHRGEVLGIAGLVGAGRTELLRVLAGLDPIVSGTVKLGTVTGSATPATRWAQGMALVSENRKEEGLALGLSVADNLTLSKMPPLASPATRRATAVRWIDRLAVRCQNLDQPIGQLSGGNQQKIAIARLLHHGVDVLLLDEPTRGIDVASKAQIYDLIDALVTGRDGSPPKAVIMVSSYLPELLGVCDRIAVMCRGRLGPTRPASDWTEASLVHEAALGTDAASEAA
jgi:ribose transport system ATP-binding protein